MSVPGKCLLAKMLYWPPPLPQSAGGVAHVTPRQNDSHSEVIKKNKKQFEAMSGIHF